ncbi:protein of unknown function DUF2846 [Geotalea daltonii FRC-32]|uniref:Lipoprotein n=1 Tax=Geotalea daltonii (strain DSM 22248 / JCM 15807 / FRC-32) TaxID=316067 RepID=A0A068EZ59_GEODF|nr:hypothetical protein [Geotalea daltonii]AID57970.1 protein of unknown function DUF2846 [Geotalea daltonii FRC-32]
MRFLTIIFLLVTISGCATTEIINQIPMPQIQASQQAQVKVCRKYIFLGDAAATIISLDRRPILRSSAGKCFSAKVTPGSHVLGVMTQGFAGLEMRELEFLLQEGQTKFLKVNLDRLYEASEDEFSGFLNYEQIIVQ